MDGLVVLKLTNAGAATKYSRGQLDIDTDDDGLPDWEEPGFEHDRDQDDDGLLDGEEAKRRGLLLATTPESLPADPALVDTDGDGLADSVEAGLSAALLTIRSPATIANKKLRIHNNTADWPDSTGYTISVTAPPGPGNIHSEGLPLVDSDTE